MPRRAEAESIYLVAQQFQERCLVQQASLLWPDKHAWTASSLDSIWDAFVGRPDTGERDFLEKWRDQLADQPVDVHRIAADVLVFYWLCPTNVTKEEKLKQVQEVVSWKLAAEVPDLSWLEPAFSTGFANPGLFYIIHKYQQIAYYLDFARKAILNRVDTRNWRAAQSLADEILASGKASRGARHVLLHLLFPDHFEPIASDAHKRKIVKAFGKFAGGASDTDQALRRIRTTLSEEYGAKIDFYRNGVFERWHGKKEKSTNQSSPTAIPAVLKGVSEPANRRAWIFQASPKYYDIFGAVRILSNQSWPVTKYSNEILPGDRAYLWIAGKDSGIVATGSIIEPVRPMERPRVEAPFVREPDQLGGVKPRTIIKIESRFNPPLSRERIAGQPALANLSILKTAQGTNFTVTQMEQTAIDGLLAELDSVLPPYTIAECAHATWLDEALLIRWVNAIERKGQAIIYGPPGTGKTFLARHLAKHLAGGSNGFVDIVQFHPSYAYEDFIEGIRPKTRRDGGLEYSMIPGRFLEFCEKAGQAAGRCVLIIDEINRANLSRVLGEIMYLLEYREEKIPLAGGGSLRIPSTVRILGTMNTADRSIALVDHALRRRFAFLALYPDYGVLERYHEQTPFSPDGLITTLRELNAQIGDKHYQVGITYFMRRDLEDQIEDIWRMEIEPYLEEYFFDQPERANAFSWDKVHSSILE